MSDRILSTLAGIFPDIDPEVVQLLYDNANIKHYPENVKLCKNGEIEDVFYILIEGQVDIYRYVEGEPALVDYLTRGTCFGEIALILDAPRTGDVVTSEPVEVLEITRARFEELAASNPEILKTVTRLVLERMLRQEERRLLQLVKYQKQRVSTMQIFMSYSRKDDLFARKLTTHLKDQRFNVWLDVFNIRAGTSWARQIGEALDQCQIMLLILSPDSLASGNVEDEWNYYLDKKKTIVPILYRKCDIPYRLFKLQHIDFVNLSYGSAFTQLIANLNMLYADEQMK
jgi:CRP-like cAMP-binding protein